MTKNTPLISVLVPVYNIERYIGQCLESLIKQSYANLEIVVVDDGSTDRSGEICDLYAKKDSRIKVVHKLNGGLVSARKAAMNIATGDYIGYVDGDDWVENDFFSTLLQSLLEDNSDVVVAGFSRELFSKIVLINNALPSGVYVGERLELLWSSMISYEAFFRHGITTYLWNKLFKKSVILDSQMSVDDRISIGEDGAAVYPALIKCKSVSVIDNHSYHYRQREDSMLKQAISFEKDREKLSVLYDHLIKGLGDNINNYDLLNQVKKYLLSTFIIRSGGVLNKSEYLPFSKDLEGMRLVVCGAGTFGQHFVNKIKDTEACNIISWVDDDYWEYIRCCLNVDPVESFLKCSYDYVVIAMVDSLAAYTMKGKLLDLGVCESQILSLSVHDSLVGQFLDDYLFQA